MKHAVLLLTLIACTSAVAEDCERVHYQTIPAVTYKAAKAKAKPRTGVVPAKPRKRAVAPVLKPGLPSLRQIVSRYDCPPPMSLPPAAVRIGYGIPYYGYRPLWGMPYGPGGPPGPAPVYPGSPHDFPPGVSIPPAGEYPFTPPTDVPEPATLLLMLAGLYLIRKQHGIQS